MFVAKNIMTVPVVIMGGAAGLLTVATLLRGKPAPPLPRPKTANEVPMKLLTAELERRISQKK